MNDLEIRQNRLKHNCEKLATFHAQMQWSVMQEIIADARYLKVKISDYLLPKAQAAEAEELPVDCPYCDRQFKNRNALKPHLGRVHKDKREEFRNTFKF